MDGRQGSQEQSPEGVSPRPWAVQPVRHATGVDLVDARGRLVALGLSRADAELVCRLVNATREVSDADGPA